MTPLAPEIPTMSRFIHTASGWPRKQKRGKIICANFAALISDKQGQAPKPCFLYAIFLYIQNFLYIQ
ncbi:hypothetical protein PBNK5_12820 [Pectobacterium brasiliense]